MSKETEDTEAMEKKWRAKASAGPAARPAEPGTPATVHGTRASDTWKPQEETVAKKCP